MPKSRNEQLTQGVVKYGRSKSYSRSGRWAVKNKTKVAPASASSAATKEVKFGKGTRTVPTAKASRYYPTEDLGRKLYVRKNNQTAKIRESLQPGVVAIVLAGRFRGKRVVVLKTLPSGLLLVTGPFKINGVPLRRVNPAYVIATSTVVDLSDVTVDAKFDDAYFKRPASAKKADELFAEGEKKKSEVSDGRKSDQKDVDAAVLAAVKKVPSLTEYLNSKFSLSKGQYPHNLKF